MILKKPAQFDISTYKLVEMSDYFKRVRGPKQLNKSSSWWGNSAVLVWDVTHYNDEELIGTRLITHYIINERSVMFV